MKMCLYNKQSLRKSSKGWIQESKRHSLARCGVKTGRKISDIHTRTNYASKDRIETMFYSIDQMAAMHGTKRPERFGGGLWNYDEEIKVWKDQIIGHESPFYKPLTSHQWKIIDQYINKKRPASIAKQIGKLLGKKGIKDFVHEWSEEQRDYKDYDEKFGEFGSPKWQETMIKTVKHKILHNEPLSNTEIVFVDTQILAYPDEEMYPIIKQMVNRYKATGRYSFAREKFWLAPVPIKDDFGNRIEDVFIDGKTNEGPWAIMDNKSFVTHGVGLGTGLGQKYKKVDNKWKKIEG